MKDSEFLEHYGKLGMHWGKRKEKEYRQKLTNILKNKNTHSSDSALFKVRNRPIAVRVMRSAASAAKQTLIRDFLTGDIKRYKTMNAYEIQKRIKKITMTTMSSVAINEALSRSAATRYASDGTATKVTKKGSSTREDKIMTAVRVGMIAKKMLPVAKWLVNTKVSQIKRNRAKNEATFNRWGGNILTDKVQNVVWQSSDLKTSVIDKPGR